MDFGTEAKFTKVGPSTVSAPAMNVVDQLAEPATVDESGADKLGFISANASMTSSKNLLGPNKNLGTEEHEET